MTGKGNLTLEPNRRMRLVLTMYVLWFAVAAVLATWWGWLLLSQAGRINELERSLGLPSRDLIRTHRMLFWESAFFVLLLVGIATLLFWLYWRDMKRAKSLQAFFASVTHELRTPLTSIRLQAETIAESAAEKNHVRRLLEDTLRLESQVERTLELARVEGGGRVFTQPLRLRPWIERSLLSWREAHGELLEVDVSRVGDVAVQADVASIQVIFRNLVENSLRHSRREHVRIELEATLREGFVIVGMRDNGAHFDGEVRKLGVLFEKGKNSQGAGVGLYLVKMLMERMGGRAEFAANPSGFAVSLSFAEARADG